MGTKLWVAIVEHDVVFLPLPDVLYPFSRGLIKLTESNVGFIPCATDSSDWMLQKRGWASLASLGEIFLCVFIKTWESCKLDFLFQ